MKLRYIYYAIVVLSFFLLDLFTTVYALTVFDGRVRETNPQFLLIESHIAIWVFVGGLFITFCSVDWLKKEVNNVWWGKWSVRVMGHSFGLYVMYHMFPNFLAGIGNLQLILFLVAQVSNGCGCG